MSSLAVPLSIAPARGRPRRRLGPLVASVVFVLAACGSNGPSAAPSTTPAPTAPPTASAAPTPVVDPATVYAAIENQVIQIRGLKPKTNVVPQLLDDAGIKKYIADSFAHDNPPDVLDANERTLKAFGLLPPAASLSDLYVKLLGSQVAGLYSPTDKKLYVVSRSGGLGAAQRTTFAHEFTHALQDQNFDLGSLKLDEIGHGDQSLGRLSLVEGDAVLSQSIWQLQNLTQADLGQLLAEAASDPGTKILLDAPPILRESLLFPYTSGLSFVQGLQASGGWDAVNAAFRKPPASTEQILHPEKYASGEAPIEVVLPKDLVTRLGTGWKVTSQDTNGEFQFAVWLRTNGAIDAATAQAAAAGWGGDRMALVDGPSGSWAVILRTVWDTAADAAEFESAATALVDKLASPASLLPGAGGTERWVVIGSDDATLNRVAGVLGLAG
jgi:hypothetical protein